MPEEKTVYESEHDSFSKSNTLISSKYKSTLFEQKVFNIVLARLQQKKYTEQGDELVCEIKANELKHMLGNCGGSFYTQLKPVAASMASRVIGFENDETETFKYVSLISYAEYKDGIFTVKFNSELKKYISPQTQFTLIELQTLLKYRSYYGLRLHEILLSRCYRKKKAGVNKYVSGIKSDGRHFKIEMELNELKLCLGVVNAEASVVQRVLAGAKVPDYKKAVEKASEKHFETWYEFRRKVIDVGVKEINAMDNGINVSYEPLKSGKGARVYGVVFYVELGKSEEKIEKKEVEYSEEVKFEVQFQTKAMIKESLTLKDIKAICEAAEYDFSKIHQAYEIASSSSTNISNLVGFMVKAIEKGYEKPVKKKNGFNNFPQREYDYDEFEKQLLSIE